MDIGLLQKHFGKMGARLQLAELRRNRWGAVRHDSRPGIDVRADGRGEFFEIRPDPQEQVDYEVIEIRPDLRHLLLLARQQNSKAKILCGHDERHWFVCAVPGRSVTSVITAMEALQPDEVRIAAARLVRRHREKLHRRNEAFVRQGEWFFIPAAGLRVDNKIIHHNEPISRGNGSKPHMCQFLYRAGGEAVMVCRRFQSGLTLAEYERLIADNPGARNWNWRQMQRAAMVYVRGRVWHPDHKTIVLNDWHRVLMNTESLAPGSSAVAFLD